MPSPSVVVVVCDETSDELDDSEFRDVFRCKNKLQHFCKTKKGKMLTTKDGSAKGLLMSGVR